MADRILKIVFYISYLDLKKVDLYYELLNKEYFKSQNIQIYFILFNTKCLKQKLKDSSVNIKYITYFGRTGFINKQEIRDICSEADFVFYDHFYYSTFFLSILFTLKAGGMVALRRDQSLKPLIEKNAIIELETYTADKLLLLIQNVLQNKIQTNVIRKNAKDIGKKIFNSIYPLKPNSQQTMQRQPVIKASNEVKEENLFIFHDSLIESKNQRYYRQADFLSEHLPDLNIVGIGYDLPIDWPEYLLSKNRLRFSSKSTGAKKAKRISIPCKSFNLGIIGRIFPLLNELTAILLMYYGLAFQFPQKKYKYCFASSAWSGIVGVMLKRAGRVKQLIYEDLDYYPGFFSNIFTKLFFKRIEKLCLQEADVISCVSQELVNLRQKQTKKPVILSRNGVSYDLFKEQEYSGARNTLIYTGTLDQWCGLDLIIKALFRVAIEIPDVQLLIIGKEWQDNFYANVIGSLIEKYNLKKNVKYLGSMDYASLPKYLKKANIGLISNRPVSVRKYSCPLKLFEYMAVGLPILCTNIGDMGVIVTEYKVGKAVPFNEKAFANAIIEMLQDKRQYLNYKKNTLDVASKFDWKNIFTKEFQKIEQINKTQNIDYKKLTNNYISDLIKIFVNIFNMLSIFFIPIISYKLMVKKIQHIISSFYNKSKNRKYRLKPIKILRGQLPAAPGYTYAYPDNVAKISDNKKEKLINITISPNEWSGAAVISGQVHDIKAHREQGFYLEVVLKNKPDPDVLLALIDGYKTETDIRLNDYLVKEYRNNKKYLIPLEGFSAEGCSYAEYGLVIKEFDFNNLVGVKFYLSSKLSYSSSVPLINIEIKNIKIY